jgi:hypothetical protein
MRQRVAALTALLAATLLVYSPYLRGRLVSGNVERDALSYLVVVADALEQSRHGIFPVYVGQSEVRFNGGLYPQAQAPLLTLEAGLLDALGGRRLAPLQVLNLLVLVNALAGAAGAYATLRRVAPRNAWAAAAGAFAYVACPGVLGALMRLDMLASFLTLPFLPWVWHAVGRALEGREVRGGGLLGLSLALAWAAHPPIALWAGTVAGIALAAGIAWLRRGLRAALVGALTFFLAAAWPLATAFVLARGTAGDVGLERARLTLPHDYVVTALEALRADVPGALLPVGWVRGGPNGWPIAEDEAPFLPQRWRDGALIPYLQLGYPLWLALAAGAAIAWTRRDRSLGALVLAAGALVPFLFPVPGLSYGLWRLLPGPFNITREWPMQRFYFVLPSLAAAVGLRAWVGLCDGADGRRRRVARACAAALLVWGAWEAAKFTRAAHARDLSPLSFDDPHSLPLRRRDLQMGQRRYAAWHPDASLHARVLDESGAPMLDNLDVVRSACAAGGAPATLPEDPTVGVVRLTSGRRTAACVRAAEKGEVVEARASRFLRRYVLLGGEESILPILTAAGGEREVFLRYLPDGRARVPLEGSMLRIATYDPAALPIRNEGWLPYRARVTVGRAGLRLETPRLSAPGYEARVNGRDVPVGASADRLVTVPLESGENRVELSFVAPPLVRWALPVSALAWLAVVAALVARRGHAE